MIGITGTIIMITMIMTITVISTAIMAAEDAAGKAIVAVKAGEAILATAETRAAGELTGRRVSREAAQVRVIGARPVKQAIQNAGRSMQTVIHGMKKGWGVIRWKSVPDCFIY